MRKMLWGGIALMVCVGVGLALARRASQRPDSFLACCLGLAYSSVGAGVVVQERLVLPARQVTNPVYVAPQAPVEEPSGTAPMEPIVIDGEQPEGTFTPDLN